MRKNINNHDFKHLQFYFWFAIILFCSKWFGLFRSQTLLGLQIICSFVLLFQLGNRCSFLPKPASAALCAFLKDYIRAKGEIEGFFTNHQCEGLPFKYAVNDGTCLFSSSAIHSKNNLAPKRSSVQTINPWMSGILWCTMQDQPRKAL